MSLTEDRAQLLKKLRNDGYDNFCVLPEGVFFSSKETAFTFAKNHGDRDVVPISGTVTGWLVKDRHEDTHA